MSFNYKGHHDKCKCFNESRNASYGATSSNWGPQAQPQHQPQGEASGGPNSHQEHQQRVHFVPRPGTSANQTKNNYHQGSRYQNITRAELVLGAYCTFCSSNGEQVGVYRSHTIRDIYGRVTCPILRKFRCPICGATGDNAHTSKYCPEMPTPFPTAKPVRRNSAGVYTTSYN